MHDDKRMPSQYSSAIIRIPVNAIDTIEKIASISMNKALCDLLELFKKTRLRLMSTDPQRDFFEVNQILPEFGRSKSILSRRLKHLGTFSEFVRVSRAVETFDMTDHRILMYEFLATTDSILPSVPSQISTTGHAARHEYQVQAQQLGIERLGNYEQLRFSEHINQPLWFSKIEQAASACTISPANIVTQRRVGNFYRNGKQGTARAIGYYGVVNEADEDVLKRMQDLSIEYLRSKIEKGEVDRDSDLSTILIPIWVENIAADQGKSRGDSVIQKINHSIIRAVYTQKSFTQLASNQLTHEQLEVESKVGFINKFHIIRTGGAASAQPKVGWSVEDEHSDYESITSRLEEDFGRIFKLCVLTWNASFYENLDLNTVGTANKQLAQLPLMLRKLYEHIRRDYYSRQRALLDSDGHSDRALLDSIRVLWPHAQSDEIYKLANETVKAIRQIRGQKNKNNPLAKSIVLQETIFDDGRACEMTLDVFGISLSFRITNISGYKNCYRKVDHLSVLVDEERLVSESGATFVPGRLNKPVKPNPLQRRNSRRQIPAALRAIEDKVSGIIYQKYYILCTVGNNTWVFSPLLPQEELQRRFAAIASVILIPEPEVTLFFTMKLEKACPLPHLTFAQLRFLAREQEVRVDQMIEFLAKRVAFISPDFEELRCFVSDKFTLNLSLL